MAACRGGNDAKDSNPNFNGRTHNMNDLELSIVSHNGP